jgi:hypothetical protein
MKRAGAVLALIVAIGALAYVLMGGRGSTVAHSVHIESSGQVAVDPGDSSHAAVDLVDGGHPVGVSAGSLYEQTRDDLVAELRRDGGAAALAHLGRLEFENPRISGLCHAIAHDLGQAAIAAAGGNVSKVLNDRDDVCGGGFTHGVVEVVLGSSTHPEKDLLSICAPKQDGSCFHGVGHGAMFATGMNVRASLKLCDLVPTQLLAARCGEGVFMQRFTPNAAGAHMSTSAAAGKPMALDQVQGMCDATRAPYSASCWFYSPTLWLTAHPEDFIGALRWCEESDAELGRTLCTKGLGSRTIKYHPDDPTVGARVCAQAVNVDSCLQGMGGYWSVHWRGEQTASDVCDKLGNALLTRRCLAVT